MECMILGGSVQWSVLELHCTLCIVHGALLVHVHGVWDVTAKPVAASQKKISLSIAVLLWLCEVESTATSHCLFLLVSNLQSHVCVESACFYEVEPAATLRCLIFCFNGCNAHAITCLVHVHGVVDVVVEPVAARNKLRACRLLYRCGFVKFSQPYFALLTCKIDADTAQGLVYKAAHGKGRLLSEDIIQPQHAESRIAKPHVSALAALATRLSKFHVIPAVLALSLPPSL